MLEDDRPPLHAADQVAVVGRDDDRGTARVDLAEQPHDLDREVGIEVPGRLVRQEQLGLVDDRARDRDPLLLAARQRAGQDVEPVLEADPLERVVRAPLLLAARDPRDVQDVGDVLERRLALDELEVLEDDADRASQVGDLRVRKRRDLAAADDDLPLGRQLLPEEEPQQRGLPGPGGARDEDELPALDLEADVAERRSPLGVALRQVRDPDQGRPTSSD